MLKFAKILIMLARLVFLVELGLGIAIASARGLAYLKLHMSLGFVMAMLLLLLALVAATKHQIVSVVLGCAFAIALPFIGLKQFPIKFGPALGAIQYAHVAVALLSIGIAEMIYARFKRAV